MPIKGLGLRLLCDASQMCGTGKAYVGDDTNDKDALKLSHVGMSHAPFLSRYHPYQLLPIHYIPSSNKGFTL